MLLEKIKLIVRSSAVAIQLEINEAEDNFDILFCLTGVNT